VGKEGQLVIKEERHVDTSPNTDFSTLRFQMRLKRLESDKTFITVKTIGKFDVFLTVHHELTIY